MSVGFKKCSLTIEQGGDASLQFGFGPVGQVT